MVLRLYDLLVGAGLAVIASVILYTLVMLVLR
jgi:hypothetical protein